uniref:SH2 domain-containing protein n=1 Tax=Macrostomum lignano TaxID=282301 RepID=A0A1I8HF71_9PLAT
MWPTAKELRSLCDNSPRAHRELRSLYERLWSGVLGLELRQVIDPVLDYKDYAMTIVSPGLDEPDAPLRFGQFAADFLRQVTDTLAESQLPLLAGQSVELDNYQRYRNCLLERFEKSPMDFALLMRDCLIREQCIFQQFSSTDQPLPADDDCGPPASKQIRLQSDARRDNIALKMLLETGIDSEAPRLQELTSSIRSTCDTLLERLSVRAKLKFVGKGVYESELAQLARDAQDTLESLQRLRDCQLLSADEAAVTGMRLLASCLVMNSQSDRVIKKGKAKYELRLRHLCPHYLSQRLLTLRVAVLTEELMQSLETLNQEQLEKLHSESGLESRSGQCRSSASGEVVLKMKFTSLPRETSHSGGGVCHQKFALVAFTELDSNEFRLPDGALSLALCCSQPVVFIDSQKPAATVTVLHDSLAALPGRLGFETELVKSANDVNKPPSLNKSLCDFVFACLKHAKDFCPKLWSEGLVFGFASKAAAASKLLCQPNYPIGSFLLRFSETTSYLSVTWKRSDSHVEALEPFSPEELKSSKLEQLLAGKAKLRYLVKPDGSHQAKDIALRPLLQSGWSQRGRASLDGYVPRAVLDQDDESIITESDMSALQLGGIAEEVTLRELMGQDDSDG